MTMVLCSLFCFILTFMTPLNDAMGLFSGVHDSRMLCFFVACAVDMARETQCGTNLCCLYVSAGVKTKPFVSALVRFDAYEKTTIP